VRRRARRAAGFIAFVLGISSCKKAEDAGPREGLSSSSANATPAAPATRAERSDLLEALRACDVEHRGLLLDLGSEGARSRRRFGVSPTPENSSVDREGASFERVSSRELALDVWLDAPIEKPALSLRVHGGAARVVHLTIDELRLGALRLASEETRILSSGAASSALARGRHRIVLRFSGAPRGSKAPLAELDWLRLGELDPRPQSHAAPTFEDIVTDVALDRVPKHSLVLRAPSVVRCWLRPAADARLEVALGLWGAGRALAELRLIRDGEPPVVLQTRKLAGGDSATWTPVSVDLAPYASTVIGLEFVAREASGGARVAFGDPMLVRTGKAESATPRARAAIVVVLASADRRRMPPWGPTGALRTLAELGRNAVTWSAHRAPTTLPAGVVASLLTGLLPRAHGLEDTSARLAPELQTIAELVQEASGRSAFFSGVPVSFAPFGFDQGWDHYEMLSPVKDLPATEPITRATRWLSSELDLARTRPTLLVVHARGGHPPWDLSREEAQGLAPPEYAGVVDPRRGGIIIGALRTRRARAGRRLLDDDWARLRALSDAALVKQDAALGELVTLLKRKGAWDETLLIVTSDAAPGDPPELPFDPIGPLVEERLLLPLYVKFPGNALAGREIAQTSDVQALSLTLLNALGLKPATEGVDLYSQASGQEALAGRAEVATLPGRYATRLGQRLLRGEIGQTPTLCALDVDPACASDVFERELIAARALWQATFVAESDARKRAPPESSRRSVVLDAETSAALSVWGDQP